MIKKTYSWQEVSSSVHLSDILEADSKFCFLTGSGISLDPPSSMLTGIEYTKSLLAELVPEQLLTEVLYFTASEREDMRSEGDFIRFEELLEHVRKWDNDLQVLDQYAKCTVPNMNHMILACLEQHGHRIVTTNFDSLIEQAMLATGAAPNHLHPAIHPNDWEVKPPDEKHCVYKLHGSLMDLRNDEDCRTSLQATLSQISKEKPENFQVEPWKKQVLTNLLQNHDLIVLGYSGLDDFDVLPTLWSIKSKRKVFWISHDMKASMPRIETIREVLPETNGGTPMARVQKNLLLFANRARKLSCIYRIRMHTNEFLVWLWEHCTSCRNPYSEISSQSSEGKLPTISLPVSEAEKWAFAALLLSYRADTKRVICILEKALEVCKRSKEQEAAVKCWNLLGRQYSTLMDRESTMDGRRRQFVPALENYEKALEIIESHVGNGFAETERIRYKAMITANIGYLYRGIGDKTRAIECFRKALSLDERAGDEEGKAFRLNNIGEVYYSRREYQEALKYFERAVKIDKRQGNLGVLFVHLNNVAAALSVLREKRALTILKEAVEIARQLGALESEVVVVNSLGFYFSSQGDLKAAYDHYQEALRLARFFGLPHLEEGIEENIRVIRDRGL